MDFLNLFESCYLCPRQCGVNRLREGKDSLSLFCGENHHLRVAYLGPHFGEEPPITGKNGSGTIFFTGCSLRCSFCQNYQISRDGLGRIMDLDELFEGVVKMIREDHVHNINFVTPDHFFPHVFQLVFLLRRRGYDLPIVYNLSGYQSLDMLKMAEDYADIYLPDFKYADSSLSTRLSKCKDYPKVALEAIAEMVRQKGFLNYSESRSELANKGTMVRHLILPGRVENSLNALTAMFLEFGAGLPISLMSQYIPVIPQEENDLNRPITREEFDKVYSHALDLGFGQLFVQFPEQLSLDRSKPSPFLPDFLRAEPFAGTNQGHII